MKTGREIAADACRACGVTLGYMLGESKCRDASRARSAAAFVLRERWAVDPTGWGTIANILQLHDGAAARYAYDRAVRFRQHDPVFLATTDKALEAARRA